MDRNQSSGSVYLADSHSPREGADGGDSKARERVTRVRREGGKEGVVGTEAVTGLPPSASAAS